MDISSFLIGYEAGKNLKVKYGSINSTGAIETITHNLGVVPDIFIIQQATTGATAAEQKISNVVGVSSELNALLGLPKPVFGTGYNSGWMYLGNSTTIEETGGILNSANASTIVCGSSTYTLANTSYKWVAIGGLT